MTSAPDIKLLFIDDDYATNVYNEVMVEEFGQADSYKMFLDPETALDFLTTQPIFPQKSQFDVLFLDINMPRINGWEFLEKLSENKIHIPKIVILSTSLNPKDIKLADDHPLVHDIKTKPLTVEYLQEITEQ